MVVKAWQRRQPASSVLSLWSPVSRLLGRSPNVVSRRAKFFARWREALAGHSSTRGPYGAVARAQRKGPVGKGSVCRFGPHGACVKERCPQIRQQVVKPRRYLLTDPRQFDILQSGPGWRGPNATRSRPGTNGRRAWAMLAIIPSSTIPSTDPISLHRQAGRFQRAAS
jgi:hypothetical protein